MHAKLWIQGESGSKSHAKPGGSILPETIQKKVPEKVERLVPNAIHDTGDRGTTDTGAHRD